QVPQLQGGLQAQVRVVVDPRVDQEPVNVGQGESRVRGGPGNGFHSELGGGAAVDLAELGHAEPGDSGGGDVHSCSSPRRGSVTSTVPGPTLTPDEFSLRIVSSTTPTSSSTRVPVTVAETRTVAPTELNARIRKPRMLRIVPAGPIQSRTHRSHVPRRNDVLAYISLAPVLCAYSVLWWMELKSRVAPAAITIR